MGEIEAYLRGRGVVVTESDIVRGAADFAVTDVSEGLALIKANDAAGLKIFGATATRKVQAIGGQTTIQVLYANGIMLATPDK
jgi:hypothetical protein